MQFESSNIYRVSIHLAYQKESFKTLSFRTLGNESRGEAEDCNNQGIWDSDEHVQSATVVQHCGGIGLPALPSIRKEGLRFYLSPLRVVSSLKKDLNCILCITTKRIFNSVLYSNQKKCLEQFLLLASLFSNSKDSRFVRKTFFKT